MIPRHTAATALLVCIGIIFFCAAAIALFTFFVAQQASNEPGQYPPQVTLSPEKLTARAAIIYDVIEKRTLFSKNASEPLPLASLTKLMAAEAVLAMHPADTLVVITSEALRSEGDSGLRAGEVWSLRDLLMLGLVASSNDAMAAAAGSAGNVVEAMNAVAAHLGLTETYFLNPTGLDLDPETSGAYGSAHDVAILAADFLKNHGEFFEATAKETISIHIGERTIEATSTAAPLLSTPGFIGAKTGYTELAGGNLVAVFDISVGHPLIAVVLGSTHEERFEDIKALIFAAHEAVLQQP
ncbi:hypothetical protein A2943_01360 [Candidatus Adlerbacteria bacterium RIFCSPLOWO2_01_FULL_51_16]|uniref:Peptidase S11 D-alanyl-D-alanine carboxypeptidase A N-terminal domain-containing protein n=1 Tax=Candidatus Adlerbacteria bacterium RIFCSPLOWO2_01_FULL_51_16 TaxID=1797243 RepID=A0A1F4XFT3_9BACT|nr:MAG: hypothetical protein A2943_01360 [Candidatus Adlerbacteria bacterium RIFCSPLOWO2_01_FULL_51_16]